MRTKTVTKFWITYREGKEVKIPVAAMDNDHLLKAHRYCREIQAAHKSLIPSQLILSNIKPEQAKEWERYLYGEIKTRNLKALPFDELSFIRQRDIKESKKLFRKEKNKLFDKRF